MNSISFKVFLPIETRFPVLKMNHMKIFFANRLFYWLIGAATLISCTEKTVAPATDNEENPRVVSDTLLIYQSITSNATNAIFSRDFKTGEIKLLVTNATQPFASNERLVYIKDSNSIVYSRLDGVSKQVIILMHASFPCLSIDSRLIGCVAESAGKYQLVILDTFGIKTTLHESNTEITYPCFSSDGTFITFSEKTSNGEAEIFSIPVSGGTAKQLTSFSNGIDNNATAIIQDRIYFLQNRIVQGKLCSEICSVNIDGNNFIQHTDFSANWQSQGIFIQQLRKASNASLIFVSDFGSDNKEIFTAQVNNLTNHTRISVTENAETFPSLIPDYISDKK